MSFEQFLTIPPLPSTSPGSQAVTWAARIDALGSAAAARDEVVDRILSSDDNDPPTETSRLHRLYRHAYTREELAGLVTGTFVSLGLVPRG